MRYSLAVPLCIVPCWLQELDDADTKIGGKMRVLDLDNDGIVSEP